VEKNEDKNSKGYLFPDQKEGTLQPKTANSSIGNPPHQGGPAMDEIEKAPRAGSAFSKLPLHDGAGNSGIKPPHIKKQDSFCAVREAKCQLRLEFLHECAGGIAVHASLAQTFAEIGDTAGVCYAFRQLFAHAKAAHPVYVELRDEAANDGRSS
jgi:hypothetical protein